MHGAPLVIPRIVFTPLAFILRCSYSLSFGPSTSTGVIGNSDLAIVRIAPLLLASRRVCRGLAWNGLSHCIISATVSPLSFVLQNQFGTQLQWYGAGGGNVTEHAFQMFQLMFAIITAAIISGAVVGKMK